MTAEGSCCYAMVSLDPMVDSGQQNMGAALANVPLDFMVGEMLLPAGPYAVAPSELTGMFSVRRLDSDSYTVFVQGINLDEDSTAIPSSLLFYCQQNSYFMAQALNGFGWTAHS